MLKQLLSTLFILLTTTYTLGQVKLNQFIKRTGEPTTGNASQNLLGLTFIDSCRSQFAIDLSGCPNVTAGSTVDVELVAASTGGTYGAGQTIASGTYSYGQALSAAVTNDNNWNSNINSYLFGNLSHGDTLVFDKFAWDQAASGADTIGVTFRVKINDPSCCVNNTWAELTIDNNSICAQILAGDSTGALAMADCDGGGILNKTECLNGNNPTYQFDDLVVAKINTTNTNDTGVALLTLDMTVAGAAISCGECVSIDVFGTPENGTETLIETISTLNCETTSSANTTSNQGCSVLDYMTGTFANGDTVSFNKKDWAVGCGYDGVNATSLRFAIKAGGSCAGNSNPILITQSSNANNTDTIGQIYYYAMENSFTSCNSLPNVTGTQPNNSTNITIDPPGWIDGTNTLQGHEVGGPSYIDAGGYGYFSNCTSGCQVWAALVGNEDVMTRIKIGTTNYADSITMFRAGITEPYNISNPTGTVLNAANVGWINAVGLAVLDFNVVETFGYEIIRLDGSPNDNDNLTYTHCEDGDLGGFIAFYSDNGEIQEIETENVNFGKVIYVPERMPYRDY